MPLAAQREGRYVGVAAGRPFIHVMCLAVICRSIAAGVGAATLLGGQHNSLICGGDPLRTTKVERAAVIVEDRQIVVGVTGHPNRVRHG